MIQILSTVQKKVISAELQGGPCSVVDVWIEDEEKMERLDSLMNSLLELRIESGLNHKVVKSRIIKNEIPRYNNGNRLARKSAMAF